MSILPTHFIIPTTTISGVSKDTAVLVFSRNANGEAEEKKLGRGSCKKGGLAIAKGLIRYTLRQARRSGLAVVPFFSDKQQGQSFGERLAGAIEHGFTLGYQRLIVCGTDTPNLTAAQLAAVAQTLQSTDLVLGPSPDGGVYLIGVQKGVFEKSSFVQMPWLTPDVFSSLRQYAQARDFSVSVEAEAADVDGAPLLRKQNCIQSQSWFDQLLAALWQALSIVIAPAFNTTTHSAPLVSSASHRGPPHFSTDLHSLYTFC